MGWKRFGFGLIAFLAVCATTTAGVPQVDSPFRTLERSGLASRRVQAGEEPLAFDAAALASVRASGDAPFEISEFPVSPGARATLVLRRFRVAAPDARMRITGPAGDELRPLPEVAHFSGHVAGEPDSLVYLGTRPDGLTGFVRSSAGRSYVGRDEAKTGYVVRDVASPANDRYDRSGWRCGQDGLPETPSPSTTGASGAANENAGLETPDVTGFQKATVIVETDQEL